MTCDPGAGRGLGDGTMLFDWYFDLDTPSQLATKYIGRPYLRDEERVVAVIEPVRQTVGLA